MAQTYRRDANDDNDFDERGILKDGRRLRVPLMMMDGLDDVERAIMLDAAARRFGLSPYISHYFCMIGQICDETRLLFCRCGMPWHLEMRECLNDYLTTKVAKRSRWARG